MKLFNHSLKGKRLEFNQFYDPSQVGGDYKKPSILIQLFDRIIVSMFLIAVKTFIFIYYEATT
jgi:hypothetical protein